MKTDALIEGQYRYVLWRTWSQEPRLVWVMLNPSTADAETDDPTIRKCTALAKKWGFGGILVINLFALRSTDPKKLKKVADPVGPKNDYYIKDTCWKHKTVVVAWGRNGDDFPERVAHVLQLIKDSGAEISLLGKTKTGQPKHPLYLSLKTMRVAWPGDQHEYT